MTLHPSGFWLLPIVIAATVAGCKPAPTATTEIESVESLAADPVRLKALREQCRVDRQKMGEELCTRVALATNKRFLGDGGKAQYTPPETPPKF